MGILDSIVGWIAEQVMNILDLITGSVLGALGCDMSVFIRYFPAAETMYEIFVAIAIGFILLNLVWQLFKNYGAGIGLSAEDPGMKMATGPVNLVPITRLSLAPQALGALRVRDVPPQNRSVLSMPLPTASL